MHKAASARARRPEVGPLIVVLPRRRFVSIHPQDHPFGSNLSATPFMQ
jgi:hypothetical protein